MKKQTAILFHRQRNKRVRDCLKLQVIPVLKNFLNLI